MSQVARIHTKRLIRLHVNPVGTIVEIEIVDVLRTHVHAERLRDLVDRHTNGFGLLTIDLHQLLRIVRCETGEQSSEIRPLAASAHDLMSNSVEVLQGIAAQVL